MTPKAWWCEALVLLLLWQGLLQPSVAWLWVSTGGPAVVRVCPGKDTLLSCIFTVYPQPVRMELLDVYWRRDRKKVVRFSDYETAWRSRVALSASDIQKGNASLTIYQADQTYCGHYACEVSYRHEHKRITVDLELRTSPQELVQCAAGIL